jgi:hypothetical protein
VPTSVSVPIGDSQTRDFSEHTRPVWPRLRNEAIVFQIHDGSVVLAGPESSTADCHEARALATGPTRRP